MLRYWALGSALYLVSLSMPWFEAWQEVAPWPAAAVLSVVSIAGAAYLAIRASIRLRMPASLRNTFQCLYAISCVIAAYVLVGPMRGVTQSILVVVMVFGGFSSTPGQMRALCAYTVGVLGLTIAWKSVTNATRYPPREEIVHFLIATAMLISVAYMAELLSRLRRKLKLRTEHLANALTRIEDLATRDELTQLINRRRTTEILQRERSDRRGAGEVACIALIDIDHFKPVNDTHGHAAGGEVLKAFARRALEVMRRGDVLARWGGRGVPAAVTRHQQTGGRRGPGSHSGPCKKRGPGRDRRVSPHPFSAGLMNRMVGSPWIRRSTWPTGRCTGAKQGGRDRIVFA